MAGDSNRRTTWVVAPPHDPMFSFIVSSIAFSGSKRPSGHTVVPPCINVDTTVPSPDTWNSGLLLKAWQ